MQPVMPMWAHFAAMAAVAGFALRCGWRDEQLAASGYLMTNLALFGFGAGEPGSPVELELAVYSLEAAGFTGLAVLRRRAWLAIPAAIGWLELATAIAHAPLRLDAWTYGTAQLGWFYLNWAVIAVATALAWRRRRAAAA